MSDLENSSLMTSMKMIRLTKNYGATANECLTEIHMQQQIKNKSEMKDNDDEVNEAALVDPTFLGKSKANTISTVQVGTKQ